MEHQGFWNEERVNILTTNWTIASSGDIARLLGTTRNTVIGKAYRLKLARKRPAAPPRGKHARWKAWRAKQYPARKKLPEAAFVPPERIPGPLPVEGGVPIMELQERHCRAIVGTGPDGLARYCGAHKEGLIKTRMGSVISSFCRDHGDRYYNRID